MAYSIDSVTADCYEGTTCLKNKFGIHDEKQLMTIEGEISFARASELEQSSDDVIYDFEYYKYIHRYLFGELYDWAGEIRTINISKKGTQFAKAEEIGRIAKSCFDKLKSKNYFKDQDFESFVESVVDFYCVTNMLHPFREGNGRTQRVFICKLVRYNGYEIDFNEIDSDELMWATIQAAHGVTDYLRDIFESAITYQEQDDHMSLY